MQRGEIRIKNETTAVLNNYLFQRGVPLPPGAVHDEAGVSLVDAGGREFPSEARVLQRRRDGSVEWMLMDVLLNLGGQESTSIFIEPTGAPQPQVENPVTVSESGPLLTLSNGLSEIIVSREGGSLFRKLVINGRSVVGDGLLADLQVWDSGGKIHRASQSGAYSVTVCHQNRLCAQIKIEGKHTARDGASLLNFTLRVTLTAGSPDVTLEHTFHCREPRDGKTAVRAIRLVIPTSMDGGAKKIVRQVHHGHDWTHRNLELAENIEIVSSSVADIDQYHQSSKGPGVSHPCAGGSVFLRNVESLREDWSMYPFYMRPGGASGFRADLQIAGLSVVAPVVGWKEEDYTLVTAFEHFRQLHPKSLSIDENVLIYGLWPEWATPLELVAGVSKSHVIWLTAERGRFDADDALDVLGRWEYGYIEPLDISFDPAWPAFCEVLDCHHLLAYQPDKYPLLENLLEPVPAAGNPERITYDRQPATGMFHFGDIVNADATVCLNNEDDREVFFPLQHYLRTGQTYAWDYGREAARHYMEVDFCEWSNDPRQSGGLIPHTGQHFLGNVYSSHQWSEGILAYYYLTGDERARHVVVSVGDNHAWWIYNKTELVCSDGREAGVPLANLAVAYRLTNDEKYVAAAKHIVENFFLRAIREYGEFKYPYPIGTQARPHKFITGYGDWSSFAGLYRLWEATGDEYFRSIGLQLIDTAIQPGSFSLNDTRGMDFFTAWAFGQMSGDMDEVLRRVGRAIPMLLRRGGHPLRRLHFLKVLDERGLIDEREVGNRPGVLN